MRIALLGDIALLGHCTAKDYFKEIGEYLSSFDYVVGNLETPFSAKRETHGAKSAYICAAPSSIEILKNLHLDAVTLANNHMFDYGKEGYELTRQLLKDNGIEWFGTEGKELYVEKEGNRIAFSGFCCYTTNPLECVNYSGYGVNAYNLEKAEEVILRNAKAGYFNILAVHAGLEHVNYPSLEHIRAARKMAEESTYVYYGHHPHVIQGVEVFNGSLIAHSLGNFCFDDIYTDYSSNPLVKLTENNRTGTILELEIEGNNIRGWREQVIYLAKEGHLRLIDSPSEIAVYNQTLETSEINSESYTAKRNQMLTERLRERKSTRDLMWYLKRLRPRYVQIILNARKNAKKYKENVLSFINK